MDFSQNSKQKFFFKDIYMISIVIISLLLRYLLIIDNSVNDHRCDYSTQDIIIDNLSEFQKYMDCSELEARSFHKFKL